MRIYMTAKKTFVIGMCCTVIAVFFGSLVAHRHDKKDAPARCEESAIILAEGTRWYCHEPEGQYLEVTLLPMTTAGWLSASHNQALFKCLCSPPVAHAQEPPEKAATASDDDLDMRIRLLRARMARWER